MPKIFLLSGASGSGKTTIMQEILKVEDFYLRFLPSYTTRKPRGSKDNEYIFVSKKEFARKVEMGELAEYEKVYNDYYGIDKNLFSETLRQGNIIKNIDVKGALKLKSLYCDRVVIIFITMSADELEKRLIARGDSKKEIDIRLARHYLEEEAGRQFDHVVNNSHLEDAVETVKTIIDSHLNKH